MRNPLSHFDWFSYLALFVGAAILVFQLAIPPIVGIGDNGDWYKVMTPGFKHAVDVPHDSHFVETKLAFTRPAFGLTRYLVSGRIFAVAARVVGPVFSRDGLFDLRFVGLLHAGTLLLGLALILAAAQALPTFPRRVLAVLLVLIFTDVGYVAFFNSFYSQTASVIFLVTTAGCFAMMLRAASHQWTWFSAFVVSSTLFATSKPQEAPQAILLGSLIFFAPGVLKLPRPVLTGLAASLLLLPITAFSHQQAKTQVQTNSMFNAFFDDLLRYSPDPVADLQAFNLNPELVRYAGTHAFEPGSPKDSPEFQTEFFARVSYGDMLFFYLKRPSRLWALLGRRAVYSFSLITHYGNFDRSAGRTPGAKSTSFSIWSSLKKRGFPGSIWTLITLVLAHTMAVVVLWRKGNSSPHFRLGLAGFATLNLMSIGAFLVCAMTDGTLDIIRQLYAFNAMTDLMLAIDAVAICLAIGLAIGLVWQRWRNRNLLA